MDSKKMSWVRLALQLKGSVIPAIYQRVIATAVFGGFISVLYYFKYPVSQPVFAGVIPSIVLGLLLVFRTNTAYERYWEGRKLWGNLVSGARNLAWQIWVAVKESEPKDRDNKIAALRLVAALPIATKLYLRSETVNNELEALVSSSQYLQLKNIEHKPLEIALWIGDYLQEQYLRGRLNNNQLTAMQNFLTTMMEGVGGCERVLRTPLPLAYAIHLKQLLLIYCLLLPFQLVKDLGWGTGPVVALISFTLFGIEEIALEIENPFGRDANDLPLDTICATILSNIEELIAENSSALR